MEKDERFWVVTALMSLTTPMGERLASACSPD